MGGWHTCELYFRCLCGRVQIDQSLAPRLVQHFPYLILKEGRRNPGVN